MEKQEKLCKVSEIAKIVINECLEKGYNFDIIKLQQLLTIMQGAMLAKYNTTLFTQDIFNYGTPIIKEILQDILTKEINLGKNNSDYILSTEEKSVIDEIIKRFGIYDFNTLKTSFVLNVLDKIRSGKEVIIPTEYLRLVFLEFGFGITEENKSNKTNNKTSNGNFIIFTEEYADLICTDFPRKWMPDPETGYVPPEHDLVKLAETTAENGFVENYCLDEDEVKQLRLIRYYKKNYNQQ